MRRIAIMLAMMLTTLGLMAVPAQSFDLNCAYSRTLPDDPIVYPGQPGVSHLHDFFGNKTTDGNSTTLSLQQAPAGSAGTTCQNTKDHAAYWAPASYLNGLRVYPKNIKAYYNREVSGPLKAYPQGLRMLAGFSTAVTAPSTSVIYWGCGSGSGISKKAAPPNCSGTGGSLAVHVLFPDCGTGALDSVDHRSHMAYSSANGGACPLGFPDHYPQLAMRINWTSITDGRTLTLACLAPTVCADPTRGGYWTEHADFINTWDQTELARLVATL